jgi:GNAT superfamily N-acetyltransferase
VLYRPSDAADIPGMARIRALEWGDAEYWENRIAGYFEKRLNPQHALSPRTGYVAVEGAALAGFAAGHLTRRFGCDGELQWINVSPEWRRSGVASGLLRAMARWFLEQGASRVCVDVDPSNAAARAFYARHGAAELKRHWLVWNGIGGW